MLILWGEGELISPTGKEWGNLFFFEIRGKAFSPYFKEEKVPPLLSSQWNEIPLKMEWGKVWIRVIFGQNFNRQSLFWLVRLAVWIFLKSDYHTTVWENCAITVLKKTVMKPKIEIMPFFFFYSLFFLSKLIKKQSILSLLSG